MVRKLKTYQTSQGFFDLAIAAPSMKAALEAWGANSNLFHQGFAKEADDPDIIAATMAKPGIILKRPVGTDEPFREHAHLPTNLAMTVRSAEPEKPRKKPNKSSFGKVDDRTARNAALAYGQEERQRKSARRKEEAALAKRHEQRERSIAKAEAALDAAEREHVTKVAAVERERAAIDNRAQAEDEQWETLRERLRAALRKARD
jgi:colicin import membrane protein